MHSNHVIMTSLDNYPNTAFCPPNTALCPPSTAADLDMTLGLIMGRARFRGIIIFIFRGMDLGFVFVVMVAAQTRQYRRVFSVILVH